MVDGRYYDELKKLSEHIRHTRTLDNPKDYYIL